MKAAWRRVRPYILSGLIYRVASLLGRSVRLELENFEQIESLAGGKILAGWHGKTLLAAHLWRGKGVWTIISMSRDGEMQDRIFRKFGFNTIRGSTGRGGVRAAREAVGILRKGETMAFTPDGPRGPSRQVQEGIMLMARKAGVPIVPVGVAAEPCWRIRSWDRYLVPKPFARGLMIFGEPFYPRPDATPEEQELDRLAFEARMNELDDEAERRMMARRQRSA